MMRILGRKGMSAALVALAMVFSLGKTPVANASDDQPTSNEGTMSFETAYKRASADVENAPKQVAQRAGLYGRRGAKHQAFVLDMSRMVRHVDPIDSTKSAMSTWFDRPTWWNPSWRTPANRSWPWNPYWSSFQPELTFIRPAAEVNQAVSYQLIGSVWTGGRWYPQKLLQWDAKAGETGLVKSDWAFPIYKKKGTMKWWVRGLTGRGSIKYPIRLNRLDLSINGSIIGAGATTPTPTPTPTPTFTDGFRLSVTQVSFNAQEVFGLVPDTIGIYVVDNVRYSSTPHYTVNYSPTAAEPNDGTGTVDPGETADIAGPTFRGTTSIQSGMVGWQVQYTTAPLAVNVGKKEFGPYRPSSGPGILSQGSVTGTPNVSN